MYETKKVGIVTIMSIDLPATLVVDTVNTVVVQVQVGQDQGIFHICPFAHPYYRRSIWVIFALVVVDPHDGVAEQVTCEKMAHLYERFGSEHKLW